MSSSSSLSGPSSSTSSDADNNFNVELLVPIIGTTVLLLVGGACCCWMHRQWEKSGRKGGHSTTSHDNRRAVAVSFSQLDRSSDMSDLVTHSTIQTSYQVSGEDTAHTRQIPHRDAYELGSDSGPNYVWRILQEDRNVARMRIPYKEIRLRARLATSRSREVRLGEYQNQQVVVKRLVKSKRSHIFHLQEFIY
ncbi:hypothetical protein PF005_g6911 [Phytophthora fragariae]|uniref:Uncharacterized protein n=1 Tax=Phytophthora fragariae TaxID=53985 RepID=A0A6A3YR02_9STRA|nr:hypothetical protein PF003_g20312 [Phytophthora fragariae]KAE8942674.1 hypothetical protein PF009_g7568 [Phytophthora fragariae]KAE9017313.1 hypothetical protein PF011_g6747 [Phytophthora fragariae]KAE9121415.1 hypothetical protein PF010_g7112 [Phytophthora fragariae]KAE9123045.1 hypothetical protein PF007_g7201 [Phytophthora fragariae]